MVTFEFWLVDKTKQSSLVLSGVVGMQAINTISQLLAWVKVISALNFTAGHLVVHGDLVAKHQALYFPRRDNDGPIRYTCPKCDAFLYRAGRVASPVMPKLTHLVQFFAI